MKSDLQTLKNIGSKMEEYLLILGIDSVEKFHTVGGRKVAEHLFMSGEVSPHIMYFSALVAAEQNRGIFSFDRVEKAELIADYNELLARIS